MSFCRTGEEGKDKIVFTTEEELHEPSKDVLRYIDVLIQGLDSKEREPEGFVQKNGDLNWGCSCLGSLPTGPCGLDFREFQTCLNNSKEEGVDCFEPWQGFSKCIKENAELYLKPDDTDDAVSGETTSDNSTNKNLT
ncbi:hypothetical protein LOTGIDRAFT_213477 [Lottia gigantea]|uniref:CHCH domain-containing protein n=1 Tax=Lottia gigantea TaxID=225164 RepID=V4B0D9_LOTGI|nr:hypothetical protein LOTGIDRAFT_213477 [Lottia gigantea]ESO99531.1 hypothetical protein LOTGIDRAFT_213477 [Lottia gigantea]